MKMIAIAMYGKILLRVFVCDFDGGVGLVPRIPLAYMYTCSCIVYVEAYGHMINFN